MSEPSWGVRGWIREVVASYVAEVCASALAKLHARLDAQRARTDALERRLDGEIEKIRRDVRDVRDDARGLSVACQLLSEDVRRVLEPEVEA